MEGTLVFHGVELFRPPRLAVCWLPRAAEKAAENQAGGSLGWTGIGRWEKI